MSANWSACDGCRVWAKGLRGRQDGVIQRRLCERCYPLPPKNLPVNLERWDGPGPLLVFLLVMSIVVALLAFAWNLLPRW